VDDRWTQFVSYCLLIVVTGCLLIQTMLGVKTEKRFWGFELESMEQKMELESKGRMERFYEELR